MVREFRIGGERTEILRARVPPPPCSTPNETDQTDREHDKRNV